jgi:hypothetical protein
MRRLQAIEDVSMSMAPSNAPSIAKTEHFDMRAQEAGITVDSQRQCLDMVRG